jgi:hypothetical protein
MPAIAIASKRTAPPIMLRQFRADDLDWHVA